MYSYSNYSICIKHSDFYFYDEKVKTYSKVQDDLITKESLKREIEKFIKRQKKPLVATEIIFSCLENISGYKVRRIKNGTNFYKSAPLYNEIYDFVVNLPAYQELIFSTRRLSVLKNRYIIVDINGTVVENNKLDIKGLKQEIDSFLNEHLQIIEEYKVLKISICKLYRVSQANSINVENDDIIELVNYIKESEYYKRNCHRNDKVCFKNGRICLYNSKMSYFCPDENINVENLKKQIILYIKENPEDIRCKSIIFNSLEKLSGLPSLKKVTAYYTVYIGTDKVRKDKIVEDNLYTHLCHFISSLPEFKKNQERQIEYINKRNEIIRKNRHIQKQKNL